MLARRVLATGGRALSQAAVAARVPAAPIAALASAVGSALGPQVPVSSYSSTAVSMAARRSPSEFAADVAEAWLDRYKAKTEGLKVATEAKKRALSEPDPIARLLQDPEQTKALRTVFENMYGKPLTEEGLSKIVNTFAPQIQSIIASAVAAGSETHEKKSSAEKEAKKNWFEKILDKISKHWLGGFLIIVAASLIRNPKIVTELFNVSEKLKASSEESTSRTSTIDAMGAKFRKEAARAEASASRLESLGAAPGAPSSETKAPSLTVFRDAGVDSSGPRPDNSTGKPSGPNPAE